MIAIKDFEMPTSCNECNFCSVYGQCIVSGEWVDEDYTERRRYNDCPLMEVKKRE